MIATLSSELTLALRLTVRVEGCLGLWGDRIDKEHSRIAEFQDVQTENLCKFSYRQLADLSVLESSRGM